MFGRSLLPTVWKSTAVPESRDAGQPFYSLQKEMNRLFDDFFRGIDVSSFEEESFRKFSPSVDIRENEKEVSIQVELPGLDEKDVEVLLTDNTLTIKGEKKEEKEDKGKNYYHVERTFGSFQRVIPLPTDLDSQKTEAKFKKGVLRITLPKLEGAKAKGKKIQIASD